MRDAEGFYRAEHDAGWDGELVGVVVYTRRPSSWLRGSGSCRPPEVRGEDAETDSDAWIRRV